MRPLRPSLPPLTPSPVFSAGVFDDGRPGRGAPAPGWEAHGGKFDVLARLLDYLRRYTSDRIVLISNYTQTLDLFAQLCKERRYPYLRLDGSIATSKRQLLVKRFNDPAEQQFAFLLSSKAGGCGLNLIGGNRLVLFDPDWNPANDKQAAGRVWRDGQKKQVYVYRFMATGTIEEKVYQRQLSKEGLANVVDGKGKLDTAMMCKDDLRKLFLLNTDSPSDTHDFLKCKRCPKKAARAEEEAPPPEAAPGARPPPAAAQPAARLAHSLTAAARLRAASASGRLQAAARGSQGGPGGRRVPRHRRRRPLHGRRPPRPAHNLHSALPAAAAVPWPPLARGPPRQHPSAPPPALLPPCPALMPCPAAAAALGPPHQQQIGKPAEDDLGSWGHHEGAASVPDLALQAAGADGRVSFVFVCAPRARGAARAHAPQARLKARRWRRRRPSAPRRARRRWRARARRGRLGRPARARRARPSRPRSRASWCVPCARGARAEPRAAADAGGSALPAAAAARGLAGAQAAGGAAVAAESRRGHHAAAADAAARGGGGGGGGAVRVVGGGNGGGASIGSRPRAASPITRRSPCPPSGRSPRRRRRPAPRRRRRLPHGGTRSVWQQQGACLSRTRRRSRRRAKSTTILPERRSD